MSQRNFGANNGGERDTVKRERGNRAEEEREEISFSFRKCREKNRSLS